MLRSQSMRVLVGRFALSLFLGATSAAIAAPNVGDSAAFDSQTFHPAITSSPYLSIDSAFVPQKLALQFGVFANYGHDSLVLHGAGGFQNVALGNQVGMDLTASVALFGRIEFGLLLPFTAHQSVDNSALQVPGGLQSSALGDLQLEAKLNLLDRRVTGGHIGLAILAGITTPTSTANFAGQDNVTGRSRLAFEYGSHRVSASVNAGAIMRQARTLDSLYIGNQFTYGAAARVRVWHGLAVLGEIYGRVNLLPPPGHTYSDADAPLELYGGLAYRFKFGLEVTAAGGGGAVRGYSSPDGRAILGVRYRWRQPAKVVATAMTAPAYKPEALPARVIEPIAITVKPPGDVDTDGDGFVDRLDKCPYVKGIAELGGCPAPDRDKDGIPDRTDRCPDLPGIIENQGCPDEDSDGDGFVDRLDACPFDAEVYNNVRDNDGCPESDPPAIVTVEGNTVVLWQSIAFTPGDELDPQSLPIVNALATMIKTHAEWTQLRIDAHSDARGADALEHSKAWANALREKLVGTYGIDGARLVTQGFGGEKPALTATSKKAKHTVAKHDNRIELQILAHR